MKRNVLLLGFLALGTALYAQQPTVASVVNAGSYAVAGPNAPVAQGSLFILFGTDMGPATLQGAPSFPLPTTLAGTSVSITVNGTTTQGIMIYTLAGQVAAVLPSKTPVGTGTLTVTYNGKTSAALPIQVVQSSFGAFTLNQGGSGTAVILDGSSQAITPLHPAAPNQTVAIWGTGLGPITGDETQPPAQIDMPNIPVEVYVGTAKANISYRGRTGFVGVDQINFQIPTGQVGCSVSVAIRIRNVVSNFTTLAVSSSGPCSDPNGLPASAVELLSSKGILNVASLVLTEGTSAPSGTAAAATTEIGDASFTRTTLAAYTQSQSTGPSIGGCSALLYLTDHPPLAVAEPGLDAGSSISLSGPNGTRQLPELVTMQGAYLAGLSQPPGTIYITPGNYTFTGTGGMDVGAFTASSTVGQRLTWLNRTSISISTVDRSQDLNVTWSGGPANGWVDIAGDSTSGSGPTGISGRFQCIVPIAPGQFTIPSFVLQSIPATSGPPGTSQGLNVLFVGSLTGSMIPPPPGIDIATVGYGESTGIVVTYK